MEPRCTGMCGALASNCPLASNKAQEKSRRSLMFTDWAVCCSAAPICSAMDMNRLLNSSTRMGSTSGSAPAEGAAADRGAVRVRISPPSGSTRAAHPRSTTVVARRSAITAGPSILWLGANSSRTNSGACAGPIASTRRMVAAGSAGFVTCDRGTAFGFSPGPAASTSAMSHTRPRPSMTKPNCARWAAAKSPAMAGPNGIMSVASVPAYLA